MSEVVLQAVRLEEDLQTNGKYMEEIDPQIKNLVSAIGRAETGEPSEQAYSQKGASGEFGRYQFMPTTYKAYAKRYLGDENAEPNMVNQNKIAYSFVKEKKDKGYNPAQIASMWNAGEGNPDAYKEGHKGTNKYGVEYDTPGYAQKVSKYYNQLKGQIVQAPLAKTFKEEIGDSPASQSGDKSAPGNFLSNLGKGDIGNAAISGIRDIGSALTFGGTEQLGDQTGNSLATIKEKAKGLLSGQDNSQYIPENSFGKTVGGALKTVGGVLAVAGGGALSKSGLLSKASALEHPEVTTILKTRFGPKVAQGIENLPKKEVVNTLKKTLEELSIKETKGVKGKAILKALNELIPDAEKPGFLKKFLKEGWSTAKGAILLKAFGKAGNILHNLTE